MQVWRPHFENHSTRTTMLGLRDIVGGANHALGWIGGKENQAVEPQTAWEIQCTFSINVYCLHWRYQAGQILETYQFISGYPQRKIVLYLCILWTSLKWNWSNFLSHPPTFPFVVEEFWEVVMASSACSSSHPSESFFLRNATSQRY